MSKDSIPPVHRYVGRVIHLLRKERGMRQSELASLTGLKQPNLSRIENGLVVPRRSTLEKVAMALDLEVRELLSESKVREVEAKWGAVLSPRNAGQLFAGRLAAVPLYQAENSPRLEFDASGFPIGKVQLTLQLLPISGRCFGLRLQDPAMLGGPTGFRSGEVLVFADQPQVQAGDFALVHTDALQVFRRVFFEDEGLELRLLAEDGAQPERRLKINEVRVLRKLVRRIQEF
ncbi:MAG: XRE family transcriptional regulator [Planctomycetota bacterium]|nr:XRE family transcriptional regulator [Planctomycetota bacterium]